MRRQRDKDVVWYGMTLPCIVYCIIVIGAIALSVFSQCDAQAVPEGGAGRDISRQISTETTEAVDDTTEIAEIETTQETTAEETDMGEWLTEIEIVEEQIAVEVAEREYNSPLPLDHDAVLREVCEASGVPYGIAMALIYTESRFDPYAVSSAGCFGYCQLHPAYFAYCAPEDNIRAGIGWLGELIAEHGDIGTALTVYAVGHDNGSRGYASVIFERAREWGWGE